MTQPAPLSALDEVHLPGALRVPRVVKVTQPAVGADWSLSVPPGVVWELLSVRALLTTSAAVANRSPRLTYADGGDEFSRIPVNQTITASQATICVWQVGIGVGYQLGSADLAPLGSPALPLLGTITIAVTTLAIDAGDQWSGIVLYVIERRPPLYIDPDAVPDYS